MASESIAERPRWALLSPAGAGAIAVLRVWGRDAVRVVDRVFRPARGAGLGTTPHRQPRLGRIGSTGPGDEVVAVILSDQIVELQCHGGPAAVAEVAAALEFAGAGEANSQCVLEDDTRSQIQAQARIDLIRAMTLRTAEILLEQAWGALERELDGLAGLIDRDRASALVLAETLRQRARVGTRLVTGWRVVLRGEPNVGKSRLFNAIVGRERAVVHAQAGTTRDCVTAEIAINGWPIELVDTAGERETGDLIEREGVARGRAAEQHADLALLVLDRARPLDPAANSLLARLRGRGEDPLATAPEPPPTIVVANKVDLPNAWASDLALVDLEISAEIGAGIDSLVALIAERLVPNPPPPGAGVPFRAEHAQAIEAMIEALKAGSDAQALELLHSLRGC